MFDNNEGDAGAVVSSCGLGIDISLSVVNIFSRTSIASFSMDSEDSSISFVSIGGNTKKKKERGKKTTDKFKHTQSPRL